MARIVIATDNFYPRCDGIARFLAEIVPRLADHFDITVIAPAFQNAEAKEVENIRVVRIPLTKYRLGDFQIAQYKPKLIREHLKDADIVFTQTIGPVGGLAIRLAHQMGKKVVSFIHSVEWELFPMALKNHFFRRMAYPFSKKITKYFYTKADLLLVPSPAIRDMMSWEVGGIPSRVIYLGCDSKKFKPPLRKEDAKLALGFDPKDMIIGYHGRISREKDLITLLRGFVRVAKKHQKKLFIVGDGVPQIKQVLTRPNVILAGAQLNVVPYLQAMDIYVMPSLTETTCLSVLEAMSCELPVVSTPVGYVKDYIRDEKNGLFFNFQDSLMLAKKLNYLIENPKVRYDLGKSARLTILGHFDWDVTVTGIVESFKALLPKSVPSENHSDGDQFET
jgi:phosphatidylinositol alpha 1,6-mannosyltransferase